MSGVGAWIGWTLCNDSSSIAKFQDEAKYHSPSIVTKSGEHEKISA